MSDLADWWDQFGSSESSSVEGFSGQAVWESAAEVSHALAVWSKAGKAIGDVAFWKRHVERFTSPKAFVLLCEALLDKGDLVSSSSLLIYWLNQSNSIPLVEGDLCRKQERLDLQSVSHYAIFAVVKASDAMSVWKGRSLLKAR